MEDERKKLRARWRAKRVKPVKKVCCFRCGSTKKLEYHHPDYSDPLGVVVLCKSCHEKLHSRRPGERELLKLKIASRYYLQGQTYEQIESELHVSTNTILELLNEVRGATPTN